MKAQTLYKSGPILSEPEHTVCVSLESVDQRESAEIADISGIFGSCQRVSALASRIPLDFPGILTDTLSNTLAAPLLRMVSCHHNDVHQGRVLFLRLSNQEGPL